MKNYTDEEIRELAEKRYGTNPDSFGGQRDGFKEGFKHALSLMNPKKVNIEHRKEIFMQKVANFIDDYPKEMLREFYDYWTEHGERDRKFRMEKEKSFDISKRLARWFKNYKPSTNVAKNQKIIETFKKDIQGWG